MWQRVEVPGRRGFMRKWVGAVAAAGMLLTAAIGGNGLAAGQPQTDPVQLQANSLPADLVTAIKRDLKMSPAEYLDRAAKAQQLAHYAQDFRAARPMQFAGAWLTADGKATVAVTTTDAEKKAQADGYQTKFAAVSADGLDGALDQLTHFLGALPANVAAGIGSVGIDVLNNQLIVAIANTNVGQLLNLPTLIARVKVVLEPNAGGAIVHRPMGGDTYLSAPHTLAVPQQVVTVCSFGFNAVDVHGTAMSISAGHCDPNLSAADKSAPVYVPDIHNIAASPQAGQFAKATLGKSNDLDYSLITLNARAVRAGMDLPRVRGANGTTLTVTGVADPVIGAPICKSGQTSAFTCGLVTADRVETQLNTDDGQVVTVHGFSDNACTLSGDSGGPLITGTLALGITSGSNSSEAPDCNTANLGLAMDGGTASLGIPITRILADANASSGGGLGSGLRVRTLAQP